MWGNPKLRLADTTAHMCAKLRLCCVYQECVWVSKVSTSLIRSSSKGDKAVHMCPEMHLSCIHWTCVCVQKFLLCWSRTPMGLTGSPRVLWLSLYDLVNSWKCRPNFCSPTFIMSLTLSLLNDIQFLMNVSSLSWMMFKWKVLSIKVSHENDRNSCLFEI